MILISLICSRTHPHINLCTQSGSRAWQEIHLLVLGCRNSTNTCKTTLFCSRMSTFGFAFLLLTYRCVKPMLQAILSRVLSSSSCFTCPLLKTDLLGSFGDPAASNPTINGSSSRREIYSTNIFA